MKVEEYKVVQTGLDVVLGPWLEYGRRRVVGAEEGNYIEVPSLMVNQKTVLRTVTVVAPSNSE